MSGPRRTHAEARAQMREGILRLGNAQLAEVGAAALSVREIARGLGVSSSAIYRHIASRDELLTILLVDTYTDLADAALADQSDSRGPAESLGALARGMRGWAVRNPARWALAYGSPVPGYSAPAEQTTGP
ncbi:MAG: TetR/AcrR family transcriptional regulator, partial [Actinobacteria bacterium]|nr:TetR/AcrR family transcriptional regulator [Actinomycetota bacterium]